MYKFWYKRYWYPVDYARALSMQKQFWEYVSKREIPGVVLLLEHNPVITLGRSGLWKHLLVEKNLLEREGIEIYEVERGGDVTYHGPGQIVGYPIINLRFWQKDVHAFLRSLEEVLILFLQKFGVKGFRLSAHTGVWVNPDNPEKIAAIGVAVRRWITYHGFALNISPNLMHFRYIVPCGISDKGVTSLSQVTGDEYSLQERYTMQRYLAEIMGEVFGFESEEIHEELNTMLEEGLVP
ncbi:MAG: lipoyl(octanoyl) transferase LipB [Candidatus Caldatribacteriaceae bacterium]